MFPLLFPLIKAVTSMAGAGGSLAEAATKTATKAVGVTSEAVKVSKSGKVKDKKGKEHDADSPTGQMIINMTKPKEMFGGLDLAKVKSAIDDKGPMGPEEEGPKTVYKQMIKQLQNISSTLLRMEETLRMLLSIEYERIQGMIAQDRDTTLKEGDTDVKKKGLLGRAAGGVGDMLGGAYGKLKGGLSGNFGKLLGLGALIFAFKKYPDQIKLAMEKVLKYFSDVYDVFKEEGFGEALKKVVDDFKNIAYPKIKEVVLGMLDSLWSMIKGAAMEWLFGTSGDKKIKEETLNRAKGVENLESMTGDLTTAGLDLSARQVKDDSAIGGVTSTIQLAEGKWGLSGKAAEGLGEEQRKRVDMAINKALTAMYEITQESDRRVRWKGIDTASMYNYIQSGAGILEGVSVNDILNAVPIIDGFESTNEQLKEFRLFKSAGVTKETPEAERDLIFKNLAEMSSIRQALLAGEESFKPMRGEKIEGADAMNARIEELKEDNRFLGAYTQAEIEEMTGGGSTVIGTVGTTDSQTELAKSKSNNGQDYKHGGSNVNVIPMTQIDASQKVVSQETIQLALQAKNIEFTQYQLARLNNGEAVFGF